MNRCAQVCDRKAEVRGFCDKHYRRFLKESPEIKKRPRVTSGNLKERLLANKKQEGDCWVFGKTKNLKEYGKIEIHGKPKKAHRVSYEVFKGNIPTGLEIDHLCRNRRCFNPDHLELVTHKENVLRGEGAAAKRARQTHCIRGHPLSGENLIISKTGRNCRECVRKTKRDWQRKNYRRKK